jgi:hypothetical protein
MTKSLLMRIFLPAFLLLVLITSCKDMVVCPAYQSTFILDDSTRLAYYSYAWKLDPATREQFIASLSKGDTTSNDSTSMPGDNPWARYYAHAGQYKPPLNQMEKTKYGIVKYEPYWMKNYKLRTAPMENVMAPPELEKEKMEDEGEFFDSDFGRDSLATDSIVSVTGGAMDSTAMDSTAVDSLQQTTVVAAAEEEQEPEKKVIYLYGYDPNGQNNVEQLYYIKYFGEMLVDTVTIEPPRPETDTTAADSLTGQGFFAKIQTFFTNLFSGKDEEVKEEDPDPELLSEEPESEPEVVTEEEEPEEEPEDEGGN